MVEEKPTEKPTDEAEAVESVKRLIKAGVELGVAEAVRKIAQVAPLASAKVREAGAASVLGGLSVADVVQAVRDDPNSIFQLAKEVWSRGGRKEKEDAADAVGKGLGMLVPHRALQAARDLASMARNGKEADLIGTRAIGPILERAPAFVDRVKQLLSENERLVRHAAIAGLVAFVQRKRKFAALGLEVILLVAEEHEKEIRQAAKWAVTKISEVDPKATAKAVGDWVKASPTSERVQAAGAMAKKAAGEAKTSIERGVAAAMAKLSNGANQVRTARPSKSRNKSKKPPPGPAPPVQPPQ